MLLFTDFASQQVDYIFTITVKKEIDNKLFPVISVCLYLCVYVFVCECIVCSSFHSSLSKEVLPHAPMM